MYLHEGPFSGVAHPAWKARTSAFSVTPSGASVFPACFGLAEASCTTPRVSSGQFGIALQEYTNNFCVPEEVVRLLRLSPTFMRMVRTLNRRYIALVGPRYRSAWETDAGGRLTTGPYRGRYLLNIWQSDNGSRFSPAGSADNQYGYDILYLQRQEPSQAVDQPPTVQQIGAWIESIAHETTHAFHRVTARGRPPATLAAQVRAAVSEEIATRRSEARIVSEIRRRAGRRLRGFQPRGASIDSWAVQRDFFPGPLRRTYLEQFVLSSLANAAIQQEGLTAEAITRRNEEVDRISLAERRLDDYLADPILMYFDPVMSIFRGFVSDYAAIRFRLRVIDARWRRLLEQLSPGRAGFEEAKERVLQEHARAFFRGLVQYDPRP